eukprot:CAMPEP_0202901066 /NCGR_PEP_ID=MMETSP1392-20130828/13071_1 /ASSEMBLY_ACC=CAM_ASM_000868 /TAXON_ID=225041 /ORGANISM="Chlamydomonas chlamydogama, Strain SAG 11-48b" /LENGTH=613 /DNA_ID=CAMNT_0049587557 /DNA_START=98 /DNA_END=1939 /DNA_ORIENTATION=+
MFGNFMKNLGAAVSEAASKTLAEANASKPTEGSQPAVSGTSSSTVDGLLKVASEALASPKPAGSGQPAAPSSLTPEQKAAFDHLMLALSGKPGADGKPVDTKAAIQDMMKVLGMDAASATGDQKTDVAAIMNKLGLESFTSKLTPEQKASLDKFTGAVTGALSGSGSGSNTGSSGMSPEQKAALDNLMMAMSGKAGEDGKPVDTKAAITDMFKAMGMDASSASGDNKMDMSKIMEKLGIQGSSAGSSSSSLTAEQKAALDKMMGMVSGAFSGSSGDSSSSGGMTPEQKTALNNLMGAFSGKTAEDGKPLDTKAAITDMFKAMGMDGSAPGASEGSKMSMEDIMKKLGLDSSSSSLTPEQKAALDKMTGMVSGTFSGSGSGSSESSGMTPDQKAALDDLFKAVSGKPGADGKPVDTKAAVQDVLKALGVQGSAASGDSKVDASALMQKLGFGSSSDTSTSSLTPEQKAALDKIMGALSGKQDPNAAPAGTGKSTEELLSSLGSAMGIDVQKTKADGEKLFADAQKMVEDAKKTSAQQQPAKPVDTQEIADGLLHAAAAAVGVDVDQAKAEGGKVLEGDAAQDAEQQPPAAAQPVDLSQAAGQFFTALGGALGKK